jgi:hypothetical protein
LELTPEALFIYMAICSPTGEWRLLFSMGVMVNICVIGKKKRK